jgi:hypothetical protein
VHVLCGVRRGPAAQRLPQLRRRVRAEAGPARTKLEGRQLSRQGSAEHQDQAQAPLDAAEHARFAAAIKTIPPHER